MKLNCDCLIFIIVLHILKVSCSKAKTTYLDGHFLETPDIYPTMYVLRRHPAYITLLFHDTYRRVRTNYKSIRYEHIYHVCTGFNTTNCGFWRNVENNKRVPSGRTTFDYFIGKLTIEDIRKHDDGIYMTGDRKNSIGVFTVKGII